MSQSYIDVAIAQCLVALPVPYLQRQLDLEKESLVAFPDWKSVLFLQQEVRKVAAFTSAVRHASTRRSRRPFRSRLRGHGERSLESCGTSGDCGVRSMQAR